MKFVPLAMVVIFTRILIAEGIKESTEGNYCSFFEDFKDNENFVRSHKNEIAEELCRREEVSDVEMTDDGFDVNYYTQYLWIYKDEQEDITAASVRSGYEYHRSQTLASKSALSTLTI